MHRFEATFPQSARVRLMFWRGALGMFRDHPIAGKGIGTFQIFFPRHRSPEFRAAGVSYTTMYAHSEYLEARAEQGIVGAAGLLFLIGATAAVALEALRRAENPPDRWILCSPLDVAGALEALPGINVEGSARCHVAGDS